MSKKSIFELSQAPSFGKSTLPKDPRFRVQKPVYRSLSQLMLAINNHPELVRPETSFDTDKDYLTEDERRYLDKMEFYDNIKYQDFDPVNNSTVPDLESPQVVESPEQDIEDTQPVVNQ